MNTGECGFPYIAGAALLSAFACGNGGSRVRFGVLYKRKPVFALLTTSFLFTVPYKNKFLTGLKTNSPDLRSRLSFVDKVIEISNLDLVKGLRKVVDYL